jgi:phosphoenolpyruvate synthase/pyruvate phosphate dikinase
MAVRKEQEIDPDQQNRQALTDEQILELARIGRKIEEHFGSPRTSNGVWLMIPFILSRAGPSLLYTRSLKRMIRCRGAAPPIAAVEARTSMYLSVINK